MAAAPTPAPPGRDALGVVTEFDDPRGVGVVVVEGGSSHPFHCTAVADGSRTIAVGTRVALAVVPGHGGRWEATDLRPLPPPTA